MTYFVAYPKIQYTIAKVKYFQEEGHNAPPGFRKELLDNEHVGRIMETLVVRKSLYDLIGKYRTDLTTAEDVEWYARANDMNIPMAIIPKVLLHKRIHNANISLNASENNRNLLKALRLSINRKRNKECTHAQGSKTN